MTIRILLKAVAALAAAWACAAHAAPGRLTCRVSPVRPVMGQAVTWTLAANNLPPIPPLAAADFGPDWLPHGQTSEGGSSRPGISSQTVTITLYPLRSGVLGLPIVQAGGRRCAAARVLVADHAPGQAPQYIAAHFEPAQPVAGEAVRIDLDVGSGGALFWQDVDARSASGVIHPLSTTTDSVTAADGSRVPVQRQSWSFTALRGGDIAIDFGNLQATPLGSLVIFPVPALHLFVQPTPAYWPTNAPVGRAELLAEAAPRSLALGGIGVLRATLSGVQVDSQALLHIAAGAAAPDGLRLYPPRVSVQEGSDHQLTPTWVIELPFRVQRGGSLSYPELRIPYLDAQRRVPELAVAGWGRVEVDDPRPRHLLEAVALVSGLVLLMAIGRLGVLRLRERLCLARWRRIAKTGDATEVMRRWRQAIARGDRDTMSLRSWVRAQRCGSQPLRVDGLDALLDAVEHRAYALDTKPTAADDDPSKRNLL